jgi:beta-phosphoglucomutase
MITAIVFDFDGVIADSEPLHLRAYQEVLEPLGIAITRDEYYEHYLGYDDETALRVIGDRHGMTLDARQVQALLEQKTVVFDQMLMDADVLYPGAAACIEALAGTYPLGIASGALKHEIVAILRRHALDRHFRSIVAAGDTPAGKPAPDPYRRAAELHGRAPGECLAIEDSRWGIEAAKTAGLMCVGITHSYPARELAAADAVITRLDEFSPELVRTLPARTPRH